MFLLAAVSAVSIAILVPCIIAGLGVVWGIVKAFNIWVMRPWQSLVGRKASPGSPQIPALLDTVEAIKQEQINQGKHLTKIDMQLDNFNVTLEAINLKLTPNSGSSLADSINRNEKTTDQIYKLVAKDKE
jgi:hypothetical protein